VALSSSHGLWTPNESFLKNIPNSLAVWEVLRYCRVFLVPICSNFVTASLVRDFALLNQIFLQKAKVFIHFTGFSVRVYDVFGL
jgi:hypothetical protein